MKVENNVFNFTKANWHPAKAVGEIQYPWGQTLIEEYGLKPFDILGPRSIYDPDELIKQIEKYSGKSNFHVDKNVWKHTCSIVSKMFRHIRVEKLPLHESYVWDAIKPGTSAGLPFLTKKRDCFDKCFLRAKNIANGRLKPADCVAYARTQGFRSDGTNKIRLVWGFPLEMVILESIFARPLLDEMCKSQKHLASGMRRMGIASSMNRFYHHNIVFNSDWKSFDQTIPTQVITTSFHILKECFGIDSFSEKDEKIWNLVKLYFCTCPIIAPNGARYSRRRKGIPSGSYFTSLVGSISNILLLTYLTLLQGVNSDLMVLGDDGVIGTGYPVNISRLKLDAKKSFSMSLDISNPIYNKDFTFLKHNWYGARAQRPLSETAQRLKYPERYKDDLNKSDLIASLYGDNFKLWSYFPNDVKRKLLNWRGEDMSGLIPWDKRALKRATGYTITL